MKSRHSDIRPVRRAAAVVYEPAERRAPFVPFSLAASGRRRLRIARRDHLGLHPSRKSVAGRDGSSPLVDIRSDVAAETRSAA